MITNSPLWQLHSRFSVIFVGQLFIICLVLFSSYSQTSSDSINGFLTVMKFMTILGGMTSNHFICSLHQTIYNHLIRENVLANNDPNTTSPKVHMLHTNFNLSRTKRTFGKPAVIWYDIEKHGLKYEPWETEIESFVLELNCKIRSLP